MAADARSGLRKGDFINVGTLSHEGRAREKTDPLGGHRLVSKKRKVTKKLVTETANRRSEKVAG
jgi:hypothetical protein